MARSRYISSGAKPLASLRSNEAAAACHSPNCVIALLLAGLVWLDHSGSVFAVK